MAFDHHGSQKAERVDVRVGLMPLVGIAAGLLAQPVSADDVWIVASDQAECLIENIEQYLVAPDPVVIVVPSCPIVDRQEAMVAMVQNSANPTPRILPDDAVQADQFIVYSHVQLRCLAERSIDLSSDQASLPKSPCEL